MKIQIIPEKCIACGLCALEAPDVFDYHDDGIVKFLNAPSLLDSTDATSEKTDTPLIETFPDSSELLSTLRKCPTGALRISLS